MWVSERVQVVVLVEHYPGGAPRYPFLDRGLGGVGTTHNSLMWIEYNGFLISSQIFVANFLYWLKYWKDL